MGKYRESIFRKIEVDEKIVYQRKCTGCKEFKEFSEFYNHSKGIYGIRCKCKVCKKKEDREYQRKNSDRINENNKRWREKNKDKIRLINKDYLIRKKMISKGASDVYVRKYIR